MSERIVFLVSRYSSISDSWNEWKGKTFDEVVEAASKRILESNARSAFDVVEVEIVRQATVAARIDVIDVTDAPAGPQDGQP